MLTLTGRVVEFDERRGLGVVESSAGTRYEFHCTAIADGTRTIAGDARVEFTLVPGPVGRFEAGAIRAVG
jgi:CspA family cold shock protein